jgi:carbonic anhydrase/acetyltransferase-like protein (isoleucine patch superfamily)
MYIEYRGKTPRVAASAFIAPTAVLVGDVTVGEESSVWFGVVLRADKGSIRIGARSSIEDNAVIHAREKRTTVVGNDVTVGHCAVLDDCTVEDGALVGSNAVVLKGASVGASAVVAAGSVVTVDATVPPGVVAAGSPVRIRKLLAGRSAEWVAHSAAETVDQMHAYRRDGLGDPMLHETKSSVRRRRSPVVVGGG